MSFLINENGDWTLNSEQSLKLLLGVRISRNESTAEVPLGGRYSLLGSSGRAPPLMGVKFDQTIQVSGT